MIWYTAVAIALLPAHSTTDTVRVCLAPTLGYRLETQDGRVLLDKSEKRKASTDGEDVLTPLVEHASESAVRAIKGGK